MRNAAGWFCFVLLLGTVKFPPFFGQVRKLDL